MDWSSLRGSAIGQEVKPPLDTKLLEYKIYYIVDMELKHHIGKIRLDNNSYGKWIIK